MISLDEHRVMVANSENTRLTSENCILKANNAELEKLLAREREVVRLLRNDLVKKTTELKKMTDRLQTAYEQGPAPQKRVDAHGFTLLSHSDIGQPVETMGAMGFVRHAGGIEYSRAYSLDGMVWTLKHGYPLRIVAYKLEA